MNSYPVVIIGAGPAGLAAAMQLQRQGVKPLVLERKQAGGLLLNAHWVENYPGFVDGIPGPELVDLFIGQAARLGVEILEEEVLNASFLENNFRIVTNLRVIRSQVLVAATGTQARKLDEGLVTEDAGKRVFYEVYPLINEKNKEIVIIGAGDAAFDYGLNLARHNKVILLNRTTAIKALPLLVKRVKAAPGIRYLEEREIKRVSLAKNGRLEIISTGPGQDDVLESDFLLAAIGRIPEYSFADPSIMVGLETLLKGQNLYLIGDLQNGSFRQTTIAVADGIKAAMMISQILEKG